jgi:hypothetical protein
MKIKFYQRILILPLLVLLWSALVPSVANGQDSIVISTTKLDGAGGEKFGSSVAIDGSNLGIGAILADGGADNSGAAYVFKITDSNKFPQTKLSGNSTAKTGDHFGNSLDISGDTLVIGAHWMDDGDLSNSGAAYVARSFYDETTETWTMEEQVELTSDSVAKAEFGYAVAISGDVVVVGARKDSEKGLYSGSVYVFRNNGSTWIREAKLYADDAQAQEYFGSSVAIDGDTIVVGANYGRKGDSQTGSVYVFKYNGSDWQQEAELFGNDLGAGDKFGYSVAIEDDTIIVGAPRHDDSETDSGAAYVFRRDAGTWIQDPNFTGSGLFEKAYFGHSVALSGNTAVVGAYRNDLDVDSNLLVDAGSAYVFRFDGSIWPEEEKLIPADAVGGEEFGWAVAISGDTVVVGAHKDGNFAGSAYVFTLHDANADGCIDAIQESLAGIIDDLSDLSQGSDKKTGKRIQKAIGHLEKSFDGKYWGTDSTLTKKGQKVYDEEKKAVKELKKIHDPTILDIIESIVGIGHSLSQTAIEAAIAAGGGQKEIDRALKEIGKAQKELDHTRKDGTPDPKYDKAIDHYKKAWKHAQKAIK